MGNFTKKVNESGSILSALGVIGFIGLVWLIIYGNLSGNVGFETGSQGYNDTQAVILNLSEGFTTFFGFAPTWFTIAAIVLLIFILVGLLAVVMKLSSGKDGVGGFSD